MIRVIFVLLVYVVGPALILWWAIKRYRSGVKPDLPEVAAVCFAVIAITSSIYFLSANVTTEEDFALAESLAAKLVTQHQFMGRINDPTQPAVYAEAEDGHPVIRIYGITDAIEQEKVAMLVEKLRPDLAAESKPETIIIKFFQKEIWETDKQGNPIQVRQKETLLHRYLLE